MRKDKQIAEQLRRSGKSYKEIGRILTIPLATLSDWFKNLDWSIEIKKRLATQASFSSLPPDKVQSLAKANKKRWEIWHQQARDKAMHEFPNLKKYSLFLAGLMLYWGEGDKKIENGVVRLGNSDPEMIKLYYRFLTKTILIPKEKVYAWLLLYPDLIDTVQKNFWSKTTGIPFANFKKSIYIKGRHPTKRLSFGVCTVAINSRELKEKMLKWSELYKNELLGLN